MCTTHTSRRTRGSKPSNHLSHVRQLLDTLLRLLCHLRAAVSSTPTAHVSDHKAVIDLNCRFFVSLVVWLIALSPASTRQSAGDMVLLGFCWCYLSSARRVECQVLIYTFLYATTPSPSTTHRHSCGNSVLRNTKHGGSLPTLCS